MEKSIKQAELALTLLGACRSVCGSGCSKLAS